MTTAIEGGERSLAHPGHTLSPGKTRYPLYRGLGRPRGRSGRAENLAPPGFDPRTVPSRSQSLYRLSYPAHNSLNTAVKLAHGGGGGGGGDRGDCAACIGRKNCGGLVWNGDVVLTGVRW